MSASGRELRRRALNRITKRTLLLLSSGLRQAAIRVVADEARSVHHRVRAGRTVSRLTNMPEQHAGQTRTSRAPRPPAGEQHVKRVEEAAESACRSLKRLIKHSAEGVSAVSRSDEGWHVDVDVLELQRIPDTTSLLATYEVDIDQDGSLLQYRRVRRYRRGQADT